MGIGRSHSTLPLRHRGQLGLLGFVVLREDPEPHKIWLLIRAAVSFRVSRKFSVAVSSADGVASPLLVAAYFGSEHWLRTFNLVSRGAKEVSSVPTLPSNTCVGWVRESR
jgi:hypothetical protein